MYALLLLRGTGYQYEMDRDKLTNVFKRYSDCLAITNIAELPQAATQIKSMKSEGRNK